MKSRNLFFILALYNSVGWNSFEVSLLLLTLVGGVALRRVTLARHLLSPDPLCSLANPEDFKPNIEKFS
jgi:hypothetical protein